MKIVRNEWEMMVHMDDGSCRNQLHCLTAVFLPACFYMSGDLCGGLCI